MYKLHNFYPESMATPWHCKEGKIPGDGVVRSSKWERQKASNFSRSAASLGEVREQSEQAISSTA